MRACATSDPERAVQRVTAMTILTLAKPDSALEILRETASRGPDGSRHVAAGVLVNLGEMPPLYGESTEPWLLVDLLTALSGGDNLEGMPTASVTGADINGRKAVDAVTYSGFGYMVWDRVSATLWSGTLFDLDGKPLNHCRLADRLLSCGS